MLPKGTSLGSEKGVLRMVERRKKGQDLVKITIKVKPYLKFYYDGLGDTKYNATSEAVRDVLRKFQEGELIEKSKIIDGPLQEVKDLALKIGRKKRTITAYFHNKAVPPQDIMNKLNDVLCVPESYRGYEKVKNKRNGSTNF